MQDHLGQVVRRLSWRIVPLLAVLYVISYLDRVNVSFAALTMNADLGLSSTAYGWGAGIFFLGYLLFQVPSNILLEKFGPKLWLSIIMVLWGLVSVGMGFINSATELMIARFLLGLAEAGFFPGIILYLTYWFPPEYRGRIIAGFMFGIPVATIIGAPLSSWILSGFHLVGGLEGWRWLFILEGAPAVLGAMAVLAFLPDRPQTARWLDEASRRTLLAALPSVESGPARARPLEAVLNLQVLRYSLAYLGLALALYGVGLWLPQMIKASGAGNSLATMLSAVPYIVAAAGMLVWGQVVDRRPGGASNVWLPALAAATSLAGLALLPPSAGLLPELILLSTTALGTLAALAAFWTVPTSRLPVAQAAVAIAVINSIGNLGGFLGPSVVGWIKDVSGSFQLGVLFMAACAAVTALLLMIEPRRAAVSPASIEPPPGPKEPAT